MANSLLHQRETPQSEQQPGLRRVLSLWDLVLFGLAFVGPTAPYSMFGIGTAKSFGHLPLVYAIAMLAMSLTAVSYGRMAAAFPEAGSTYAYASKALHPQVGYFGQSYLGQLVWPDFRSFSPVETAFMDILLGRSVIA